MLPLWLATEMHPGGGYGATICAHRLGRRYDALPVRPGQHDAELVRGADQLALERPPLLARLAVPAACDERRAHAAPRARPQHCDVRRRRRAHEGEFRGPLRHLGDALEAGAPEDLTALAVHGVDVT